MVKNLLQHEFFVEELVTVELLTQPEEPTDKLTMRMKVQGQVKKNGEEAIEFVYDLKTEKAEEVVGEMVSGYNIIILDSHFTLLFVAVIKIRHVDTRQLITSCAERESLVQEPMSALPVLLCDGSK